ncbi:MAG: hypothetical protein JWM85_1127 [Acidimicrobiaceae bacterium]|nr:hypothetical protein [Acidimicrobiaceae bacterium]
MGRYASHSINDVDDEMPFAPLTQGEMDDLDDRIDRAHRPFVRARQDDIAQRPSAPAAPRTATSRSRHPAASRLPAASSVAQGTATGVSTGLGLVSGKQPPSLAAGVLGLVAYAVAINYIHGGWPQVKGWLAAKFVNQPYTPPASSAQGAKIIPFPSTTSSASSGGVVTPGSLA